MSNSLLDPVGANSHMDRFVLRKIDEFLSSADFGYTLKDLNTMVNDEETLLEYIRDSEKEFNLPEKKLTDSNINSYVRRLDLLWEVVND